jgi:hypothetical protein
MRSVVGKAKREDDVGAGSQGWNRYRQSSHLCEFPSDYFAVGDTDFDSLGLAAFVWLSMGTLCDWPNMSL